MTDELDKKYGIWDDIFTDGVDVHYRGGLRRGPNVYGPVLFKIPVGVLLTLPKGTEVMVTRENPYHWTDRDELKDRYFLTTDELQREYTFGDFKQHIVIRTPTGHLPFPDQPIAIEIDNPKRIWIKSKERLYDKAVSMLEAAAEEGSCSISCEPHVCKVNCQCVKMYSAKPNLASLFK